MSARAAMEYAIAHEHELLHRSERRYITHASRYSLASICLDEELRVPLLDARGRVCEELEPRLAALVYRGLASIANRGVTSPSSQAILPNSVLESALKRETKSDVKEKEASTPKAPRASSKSAKSSKPKSSRQNKQGKTSCARPLTKQRRFKDIGVLKGLNIHFIGIGGIGISGLALFLKEEGNTVAGSDISLKGNVAGLLEAKIKVRQYHRANNIARHCDLVIHSAIIKDDNVEILEAKRRGIPILSRRDALGLILQNKKVISICGAHGKSTISAMMAALLPQFSAIIGAVSKEFGANVRAKNSEYVIFEADESDASFLNSNPTYAIVPNAEPEHMECYSHCLEQFYASYSSFLGLASHAVVCVDDPFLQIWAMRHGGDAKGEIGLTQNSGEDIERKIDSTKMTSFEAQRCVKGVERKTDSTKSIESKIDSTLAALSFSKDIKDISYHLRGSLPFSSFTLYHGGERLGRFSVAGLGSHIITDAALCLLAAKDFYDTATLQANLLNYAGIKKRFDIVQEYGASRGQNKAKDKVEGAQEKAVSAKDAAEEKAGLRAQKKAAQKTASKIVAPLIIDDYGHHPTEIRATLSALFTYLDLFYEQYHERLEVTCIFQPHKYSRFLDNLEDFRSCFDGVDRLIVLPVWAASEEYVEIDFKAIYAHHNLLLASRVRKNGGIIEALDSKDNVIERIEGGCVMGFSAGDLTYALREDVLDAKGATKASKSTAKGANSQLEDGTC